MANNIGASTRRSATDKKKPKQYGNVAEFTSSDGSSDDEQTAKQRMRLSSASYSPSRANPTLAMASPPHSIIHTTKVSRDNPAESIGPAPHAHEVDSIR